MGKDILLSKEHGVNPTMVVCFWCGEDDGSIAMLGKITHKLAASLIDQGVARGDAHDLEAPRRMVINNEPCAKCAEGMATGITLMEATGSADEPGLTGRYWVITEEAARDIFKPEGVLSKVLKHRKAFIDPETVKAMCLPTEDAKG